jgi:hypothetical protein
VWVGLCKCVFVCVCGGGGRRNTVNDIGSRVRTVGEE